MTSGIAGRDQQVGAVLVVALIMLLLVTLMAVAGFNLTQTNLKIMENMESKRQAIAGANSAIEEVISSALFVSSPSNLFSSSCGAANTQCYDFNDDGQNDINVSVEANCVVVEPIENSAIDIQNPMQKGCLIQDSKYSLCANTVWELTAVAVDQVTSAQAQVRQGVSLMVLTNDAETACPGSL